MKQSNDSLKKDVYYRLLSNSSYNWRSLLTLSVAKILSKLHKVQDTKAIKVFILDDTVEDKVGKNVEGSCDKLWSNKVDQRTNAHKRRLETMKGKSQIAIDMVKRAVKRGIYVDYLLVDHGIANQCLSKR